MSALCAGQAAWLSLGIGVAAIVGVERGVGRLHGVGRGDLAAVDGDPDLHRAVLGRDGAARQESARRRPPWRVRKARSDALRRSAVRRLGFSDSTATRPDTVAAVATQGPPDGLALLRRAVSSWSCDGRGSRRPRGSEPPAEAPWHDVAA